MKQIKKIECVGHIQKRMGRELNNHFLACKERTYNYKNGKKQKELGENKLTKKEIYRIQGRYGAAIRKHVGNENVRSAIWAI